ncbi:phosphate acyltransferase PlsX [Jeotgalicoccus meleagridis]|uniref:Phosphate acyltransferase n=1 Tax=Jeotgalicoccus meleagridis TaxID=2759181 RepID=A0A6V7R428_9STAP|nr:phosphate acyltransferase PlsX [Jeotgalicoccus meleagridis]CAD2071803.1 Phosphate acyltransferase [Jeotgalicoccus meleagridis]
MIKIAVDTMGGDYGPEITIPAVLNFLNRQDDVHCLLFGHQDEIMKHLPQSQDRISVIHTENEVTDHDAPLKVVRSKPSSALVQAIQSVAGHEAHAFVSAGHSGAIYASSLKILGKSPGISRPASVTVMPTTSIESPCYLLIDSGANIASKPEHLVEYAKLGQDLAQNFLQIEQARIGLLNIGSEKTKGNDFTKTAHTLLESETSINFIGNVEPNQAINGNHDIILANGFDGNIMLKAVEGTAKAVINKISQDIKVEEIDAKSKETIEKIMAKSLKRYTNEEIGGGFILGLPSPIVITHGHASMTMFENSLNMAYKLT